MKEGLLRHQGLALNRSVNYTPLVLDNKGKYTAPLSDPVNVHLLEKIPKLFVKYFSVVVYVQKQ